MITNDLCKYDQELAGLVKSLAESFFPEFSEKNESGYARSPLSSPLYSSDTLDSYAIRRDFPILETKIGGKDLVWLDNAATTQKPYAVISRLKYYYEYENSNIHRGAHTLAAIATDAYEEARGKAAGFINAPEPEEIVFVRGATEGINLVAQSYGRNSLRPGDEVIVSLLEHHSNIVPWQMACAKTGAVLKVIPVDDNGLIMMDEYEKLITPKTKIVALTHVSNVLGTIAPVAEMADMAHRYGAKVLVDGAQAPAHMRVDVRSLDCDFYVFSGHKIFGPTGIGVLFGRKHLLESMEPWQGGGNMIYDVTFENTSYNSSPHKFEAGTGNIAGAIVLGTAMDYITKTGIDAIYHYEHRLYQYARRSILQIPGISVLGNGEEKISVISFNIEGIASDEVGKALNREGIAVRAGHHCAQPILRRFGAESAVRVSLALYNTFEEIDFLVSKLWELVKRV